MSFQTDNAWPAGLRFIFERAREKHNVTFEDRYYGPYDKLLNYCFGNGFTFYVSPQYLPVVDSRYTIDLTIFLVKSDSNDKPVFILKVKDDSWAQKAELRFHADKQMRDHYALVLDECPYPASGVSAFSALPCASTAAAKQRMRSLPRTSRALNLQRVSFYRAF